MSAARRRDSMWASAGATKATMWAVAVVAVVGGTVAGGAVAGGAVAAAGGAAGAEAATETYALAVPAGWREQQALASDIGARLRAIGAEGPRVQAFGDLRAGTALVVMATEVDGARAARVEAEGFVAGLRGMLTRAGVGVTKFAVREAAQTMFADFEGAAAGHTLHGVAASAVDDEDRLRAVAAVCVSRPEASAAAVTQCGQAVRSLALPGASLRALEKTW